jgi:hypothetical protein
LSPCLPGDLAPSLACIPQLSDSRYPFTAQWLLYLPQDLTYKSSALVSSGNMLLASPAQSFLVSGFAKPNDHIFLFHYSKLRILPTQYIDVFHMILTINSDCFPKQH